MWRKGNLPTLLVGRKTDIATLENSVEVPQKVKDGTTQCPSNCTTRYFPKDTKILIQRGICTPVFIAALSTIAKVWKEHKCPVLDKWIKMWHIYTMGYY